MRRRLLCLAAVLALFAAPACSDDDGTVSEDAGTSTTEQQDGTTTTAEAPATTGVTMKDFAFDPKAVAVPEAGATLRLDNKDSVAHTFTIDSLNVDQEVAPGSQVEVQVKAPDSSTTFYCRFHRGSGMEGTLRAEA